MKILVLSDSHSGLRFMRKAITATKPNAVIHLGDYCDDGETMAEEFPRIPFHIVAGNCDQYRNSGRYREMLCYSVCGVKLFITHGHRHYVKSSLFSLCREARELGAAGALFGHTHIPYCQQENDGLWVLNPGSCGSDSGTVAIIETENNTIKSCEILSQADLEEAL